MEMSPEYDGTQAALDDFQVSLEVFEGPFDLLLQLISRKKLDITQVALAEVTDEFIAYMHAFPDLSRTSEFLVVAATLLDMKAARLLPDYEEESSLSSEDLEARDLLFSRLLQYRAFKLAAGEIAQQLEAYVGLIPRSVALEPQFTRLLPELRWEVGAEDLARACADALSAQPPTVEVTHLHSAAVPVAQEAKVVISYLSAHGHATFSQLISDARDTAVVVSRFLAILELYRRRAIEFQQEEALSTLELVWNGNDPKVDEWEEDV